jgi:hypothetical protein
MRPPYNRCSPNIPADGAQGSEPRVRLRRMLVIVSVCISVTLAGSPVFAEDAHESVEIPREFTDRLRQQTMDQPADFDDPPGTSVEGDYRFPDFVRVIEFGDYAYRAPSDFDSNVKKVNDQVIYEKWQISNRTTFMAFNGSLEEAKVRVQALSSIGTVLWEYDIGVLPGHTAQLLRHVLDSKSAPKPNLFIVSSNRPVIVTAHTIEEQHNHYTQGDEYVEKMLAIADYARASQTSIPVRDVDCRYPEGYEWLCAAYDMLTDWDSWIVAPGQSAGTIINP